MKRITYVIVALIFFTTPLAYTAQQAASPRPVTRAAFDLGSGTFKLVVADVQGEDVKIKFSKSISVGLGMDLAESKDQSLSNRVQDVALKAMQELKKDAEKYKAKEYQGIATEVFRKAKNGEALLNDLTNTTQVDLQIISQEKEGQIGFNTASVLSPEVDQKNLISWDSGGASFQIMGQGEDEIFKQPIGSAVILKIFMEEIRKQPYTQTTPINPISPKEGLALVKAIQNKITVPNWLKNKLKNPETMVIGIGDSGSMFAIAAKQIGENHFTIDQVKAVMEEFFGKSDEELKEIYGTKSRSTTEIILLYAVMEKFGIQEVTLKEANGSTIGLLIDQEFWNQVVPNKTARLNHS